MVNKSASVSPTVVNFICKMSLQDGEIVEASYERDLSNGPKITGRDETGRPIGVFPPSLAYFNHKGLVKDNHGCAT